MPSTIPTQAPLTEREKKLKEWAESGPTPSEGRRPSIMGGIKSLVGAVAVRDPERKPSPADAIDLLDFGIPLGTVSKVGGKIAREAIPEFLKGAKKIVKEEAPEFLKGAQKIEPVSASSLPEFLRPEQRAAVERATTVPPIDPKTVKIGPRQIQAKRTGEPFMQDPAMTQHKYLWDQKRVDALRRGVRSWGQTEESAMKMVVDEEFMNKIYDRKAGAAFNAEELRALEFRSIDAENHMRRSYADMVVKPNDRIAVGQFYVDWQNAVRWQERYFGGVTEAGRSVNILKRKTPQMETLQHLYRKVGGPEKITEWSNDMREAYFMLDWNDNDAMRAFMENAPDPAHSNWDKVFFAVQNGWLSAPRTHFRNIVGNTAFILSKLPETAIAGGIDRLLALKSGRRTIYSAEAVGQAYGLGKKVTVDPIYGLINGMADGVPNMLKNFRKALGDMRLGGSKAEEFGAYPIKGKLGEFYGFPMTMLNIEDAMAKALVGQMDMYGLAVNRAMQKGLRGKAFFDDMADFLASPPEKALRMIEGEKLYRTFQKELGKVGKGIMKSRENWPGLRYVIPFVRTPANILKAAAERAPISSQAIMLKRYAKGAYKGQLGQRTAALDASRAIIGHAIAGYITWEFIKGNITGPTSEDAAMRSIQYMNGMQEYIFRTADGRYMPIGEMIQEPYSLVTESIANVVYLTSQAMKEDRDLTSEELAQITLAFTANVADRSFLRVLQMLLVPSPIHLCQVVDTYKRFQPG